MTLEAILLTPVLHLLLSQRLSAQHKEAKIRERYLTFGLLRCLLVLRCSFLKSRTQR